MRGDPRQGLTQDRIKELCSAYMTQTGTPVREIAAMHKINHDRFRAIVKAEGCTLRGRDFALIQSRRRVKRSQAQVFHGMPTTSLKKGTPELELAKTILRRRYPNVYEASVTDGDARGKGFVYCGKERLTYQEVLMRAAQ